MTRKETLKNKIVMIGSGKSAPFYLLIEKIKITTHVTNTSLYEYIGNAGKKTCPIACVYFDGDNGYCTGFSAETASYDDTSYVAWFNKEHGNGVTFLVIWIQL